MSQLSSQGVIVLDSEKKFLEYTTPGMARKLLKEKKAKVFSMQPFAIKLVRSVSVSFIRKKKNMAVPKNFTEFFKEEKDIFVQNLANAQVSCEFNLGNNRIEGFLFPNSRSPVNLTNFIPFDAIKQSMDFRKMLSRRPPALQLLTTEQYDAFFSNKAIQLGLVDIDGKPNTDAAIDAAEEQRRRTADRDLRETVTDRKPEPIHEVIERGTGPGGAPRFGERQRVGHGADSVGEDEIINPRILHLCNQVKAEVDDEEKMPAIELLEALQNITGLSLDDYEYIRSHGYYKTVKKWAKMESNKLVVDEEKEEAVEPALA